MMYKIPTIPLSSSFASIVIVSLVFALSTLVSGPVAAEDNQEFSPQATTPLIRPERFRVPRLPPDLAVTEYQWGLDCVVRANISNASRTAIDPRQYSQVMMEICYCPLPSCGPSHVCLPPQPLSDFDPEAILTRPGGVISIDATPPLRGTNYVVLIKLDVTDKVRELNENNTFQQNYDEYDVPAACW
jgi:hypothetical protein